MITFALLLLALAGWTATGCLWRDQCRLAATLRRDLAAAEERNEALHARLRTRRFTDLRSYPERWRRQAHPEPVSGSDSEDRHVVVSDPTYDEEETTRCR